MSGPLHGRGGERTPQNARKAAEEAIFMDAGLVARFLAHLKAEGRPERYRRNMRTYLAH